MYVNVDSPESPKNMSCQKQTGSLMVGFISVADVWIVQHADGFLGARYEFDKAGGAEVKHQSETKTRVILKKKCFRVE